MFSSCQLVFILAISLETDLGLKPRVIKFNYLVEKTRSTLNPEDKTFGL